MPLDSALTKYGAYKPALCTSTTRPANPFQGQTIYETDTGSFLVYYGATTGWKLPWNQPWGHIVTTTSQSNTISGGYLTGVNTTFTAISNRRYKITGHCTLEVVSGRVILSLSSTTSGALFRFGDLTGASYVHSEGSYVGTLAAGSHTIQIQVVIVSGTTNGLADSTTNLHRIVVEDIGPATSTAPTS